MSLVTNNPYTGSGFTTTGAASQLFGVDFKQVAHATYNFNLDGGAVSTITPSTTVTLPQGAIITGATINSSTACASTGSGTLAVGTSAGSTTTSILNATAVATLSANALVNGTVTFASPVKLSAAGKITVTIATAAFTAGVVEIFVYYIISPT